MFPVKAKGQYWVKVSKPNIQPFPPFQYWENGRKQLSLYFALFKHTYNAQIFTKKISDVIQPFMNNFFEKNWVLIAQKTLF